MQIKAEHFIRTISTEHHKDIDTDSPRFLNYISNKLNIGMEIDEVGNAEDN